MRVFTVAFGTGDGCISVRHRSQDIEAGTALRATVLIQGHGFTSTLIVTPFGFAVKAPAPSHILHPTPCILPPH